MQNRYRGCLVGGAVGDALGAPVEFLSLPQIIRAFGPAGIRDFAPAYGRLGAITDDTQMTLFTAEGLIRAAVRQGTRGICHPPSVVHRAYLRWLQTQGLKPSQEIEAPLNGWLAKVRPLWSRRAPGQTCLSALKAATTLGTPARNDSKGCGGVMRIAPVGLITPSTDWAFSLGMEIAALTHGHPSSSLSAGALAGVIAHLKQGDSLADAIEAAKVMLSAQRDHAEVLSAIEGAEALAASEATPNAASTESLGKGWVAEEALAMSLYCVLVTSTFEDAIILAVNHSGDSDSTGAIAGNIAGILYGVEAIPDRWTAKLELLEETTSLADDLLGVRSGELDLRERIDMGPVSWELAAGCTRRLQDVVPRVFVIMRILSP